MIAPMITSLFSVALFTQFTPQEISLSIEINELKLNEEVLIAECNSRGIRVVTTAKSQGFIVVIREVSNDNLQVAITDLDGETSLRDLKEIQKSRRDGAPIEREIALIVESVVRRWERKRVQEAGPKPSNDKPTAEPERRPTTTGPDLDVEDTEGSDSLFDNPTLDVALSGGVGLNTDPFGPQSSPGIAMSVRYGGDLSFGLSGSFYATDVNTSVPLARPKGDFSEWTIKVQGALRAFEALPDLSLVAMLGLGFQNLNASEGFEADGLSSMLTLGTEYRTKLVELQDHRIDLALGAFTDWTWIGPTFTWTTGESVYEVSRLRGRMQLGFAWQWR